MNTIIELFDSEQMENAAANLFFPDERIIYLGYEKVMTEQLRSGLEAFFASRGCSWKPEFISVERHDLMNIVSAVEDIARRSGLCMLDLTGGSELVLVAMGMLSERHGMPMFQIDLHTGSFYPVSGNIPRPPALPKMTVKQLITLYGGSLCRAEDREIPTSAMLRSTVNALWRLCADEPNFFNRVGSFLNSLASSSSGLYVHAAPTRVSLDMRRRLEALSSGGFITRLSVSRDRLFFTYRDETVKRLLTKAGLTLEIFTRLAAERAGIFDDVRQGISVEWEPHCRGSLDPEDTSNEIDLILTRAFTPFFISCKNGEVKKEALYELDVVAQRFGGKYVKKVLVCAAMPGSPDASEALRRRADDMNILLIEGVCAMSPEKLTEKLHELK